MPAVRTNPAAAFSQRDLDQARLDLLRRRVTMFGTVVGLLLILLGAIQWWVSAKILSPGATSSATFGMLGGMTVGVVLMATPYIKRRAYMQTPLRSLVWRTIWIVTMAVISQVGGAKTLSAGISEAFRPLGFTGHIGPVFVLTGFMVVLHTAAAIIVPWTLLEACAAPLIWAGITLLMSSISNDSANFILLGLSLTLLSGVPGVMITLFRAGGLRDALGLRLMGARYAEVERELVFARRLHERLFPSPIRDGAIRLDYAYEPMRQIGGDFLDASRAPDGSLLVVMIDVTGHGVAAALAVNRLHGEIKRLLAEAHGSSPADVIRALNRYVHLTLADESIFATAVAARIQLDGNTLICVAGHPPPLLRSLGGGVSPIEPTAPILGPFAPDDFHADQTQLRLTPAAVLMLYTDGATECRDTHGSDLGQSGLEQILAAAPVQDLPAVILRQVSAHRSGPAEDDILIAGISIAPATH